ncbi:MAG TPA: ABC transporter ATP-binding protein [bacterium]|nr:ABC transporter ATP-binding protein [bacterium]HOM27385.1 ABC transporter ATP-binding protein [bacterium]
MVEKDKFYEQQKIKYVRGHFFGPPGPGRHMNLLSEKPKETIKTLKKLFKYLGKYKLYFLLSFVCILGSSILFLIGPYLIGKGIDYYIIPKNLSGFGKFLLFMLVIYIFNSLLVYIQSLTMANISQRVGYDLRKDAFECIHKLFLKVIDKRTIGDIMSRITNDIDMINMTLATSITQFFSGIIMLSGTIVMMIILSPLLTLFSIILIPVMIFITKIISGKTRKYFFIQQTKLGELNGIAEEDITGLRIIKIFGKEEKEIEKFEKINEELKEYGINAQKFAGIMPPLMNFLNNISFAIIGGIGGVFVLKKIITIGTIASFINYVKQFTRPLNELANQFNTIQTAIASAERVFEIMEEEKEKEDEEGAIELKEIKGEVEFKNVWFAYEDEKYVLKNINFKVPAGKIIAIVGPTGAGKTTIINLLARLYEVEKGEILIDGYDIRKIKKESLRSFLGVVLQDTYLFAETVKENIRYGKLEARDEEIQEVCRVSNAEKFILNLPKKYQTVLSDSGQSLSQGQRQLIAISRAILAKPKILILDEATSNIDTKTEMDVQKSMLNLMKDKTNFVIAHRLNTVKNADLILVIKEGEIIEKGNHKELMNKKGFYYNLFTSQFGEVLND